MTSDTLVRLLGRLGPWLVFVAVYAPSAGHGFISDDFGWILHDRLENATGIARILFQDNGFYRPIVGISFALNEAAFGVDARPYGIVNVILALICGLLMFALGRSLRLARDSALCAAGLWLLNFHGINIAVLWIYALGRGPEEIKAFSADMASVMKAALRVLSRLGPLEVVVDNELDSNGQWRAVLGSLENTQQVHAGASYTTYAVGGSHGVEDVRGNRTVLTSARLSATADGNSVNQTQDGNLLTRWVAKHGDRRESFVVEFEASHDVSGLLIELGGYTADFPTDLVVETSNDGVHWIGRWSGDTAAATLYGALRSPRRLPLEITFPPAGARFVRLTNRQLQQSDWSIPELRVYGAPVGGPRP
jgi:hypothetical protein